MRHSLEVGLSFGLTSGTITTLGMIVGLHAGTESRALVLGAILLIAVADAMSDALGIHVSEETEQGHSTREIWEATLATFMSKFLFALCFAVPVLVLPLAPAIVVCIGWGMLTISISSILLARRRNVRALPIVVEHLVTASLVIVMTHLIGDWVARM